jgi:hypothetical protein
MARTAYFVPEYTDWFGTVLWAAVDAVLMKCPNPCLRNTGSAAAVQNPFDVHVDHLVPVIHPQVFERGDRHYAGELNGRALGVGCYGLVEPATGRVASMASLSAALKFIGLEISGIGSNVEPVPVTTISP